MSSSRSIIAASPPQFSLVARALAWLCGSVCLLPMCLLTVPLLFLESPRNFFSRAWEVAERPKCLDSPEWHHEFFTLPSKIKIHCAFRSEQWRNRSLHQHKPLMFFIHGFPENWYSWKAQMRAFEKDYFVVAIDLRGFGDSDKPIGMDPYFIDNVVQDVREVIRILGYPRAIIVGHDWGAAVAYSFAMTHPKCVSLLIILNGPHPIAYLECRTFRQVLMGSYVFAFTVPVIPEQFFSLGNYLPVVKVIKERRRTQITEEECDVYRYYFARPGAATGSLNYYRNAVRLWKAKAYQNRMLKGVPTCVLWGDRDPYLDLETGRRASNFIEDFEFHAIEDCSHWTQQDAPEDVNKAIADFISRRLNNTTPLQSV
eukprot:TRINITY_DN19516_c0_g1::TRINITY_DN19516_c0_g1_i1::g.17142::m.17142 TRINITY_DN19516_c0_g1::TRINITY_DN19516_c0_g1_i1::g.17142  ORF type:complete len:417 (+),score=35.31,sp/Q8IUS5/EPHX4_HUMAN/32.25/1e-60,Abhydrolase_6/PF12697.2/4.8e-36,Abhydrolase_1/PF00561.15/7.4e-22,Abhydrolase_5/PF12695.2/1.4e-12,Hydrolase_4/PF12146.3/6.1e+03,Hydrolase_4/PF12146.3/1.5e-05,Ndr/PF03096.9/0.00044,Abhydrolase_2/PF02230.11/36,Abhydrolase_2/PF02230.11/0.12 TRINITY_DN19516_c0_g1_i1:142-1251(+)